MSNVKSSRESYIRPCADRRLLTKCGTQESDSEQDAPLPQQNNALDGILEDREPDIHEEIVGEGIFNIPNSFFSGPTMGEGETQVLKSVDQLGEVVNEMGTWATSSPKAGSSKEQEGASAERGIEIPAANLT